MRSPAPAACLALLGCGQLLGLDDYRDAEPLGGASGTPASTSGAAGAPTSSTGSGGAGGGAGSGGAGGDIVLTSYLVFVTTFGSFSGNFGPTGPTAADEACAQAATNGLLPGTFTAWLSVDGASAAARLGCPQGGPWALVSGTTVAETCADLTDGSLLHSINQHETGVERVNALLVWTGTDAAGNATGYDCGDWTSSMMGDFGSIGSTLAVDSTWTRIGDNGDCTQGSALYCFQTGP